MASPVVLAFFRIHPKAGGSPSGLVVAWTAPGDMVVDVRYAFGLASPPQSRGIGYSILKRSRGVRGELVEPVDTEIVALSLRVRARNGSSLSAGP